MKTGISSHGLLKRISLKVGKTGLKKSLNTMLKNYLTDTMRSYCSIEYEIDAEGKKLKTSMRR